MTPQRFGFLPTKEFWDVDPSPAPVASIIATGLALLVAVTLSVVAEAHGPANIALIILSFYSLKQVGLGLVEKIKRREQKQAPSAAVK